MEETSTPQEEPSSISPSTRALPPINETVPPTQGTTNDAPPAYTPWCSTSSLHQLAPDPPPSYLYTATEQKAIRVLGIGAAIMGSVSIFMSLLAVVFGTIMYCSGTGMWGGITTTINGIMALMRLEQRNTRCQSITWSILSMVTVLTTLISIALAIIGTSDAGMKICCSSSKLMCNIVASQMANTCIASLAFIELVFGVMLGVIHSKYAFDCCNGGADVYSRPPPIYLDDVENDSSMRYRLW